MGDFNVDISNLEQLQRIHFKKANQWSPRWRWLAAEGSGCNGSLQCNHCWNPVSFERITVNLIYLNIRSIVLATVNIRIQWSLHVHILAQLPKPFSGHVNRRGLRVPVVLYRSCSWSLRVRNTSGLVTAAPWLLQVKTYYIKPQG